MEAFQNNEFIICLYGLLQTRFLSGIRPNVDVNYSGAKSAVLCNHDKATTGTSGAWTNESAPCNARKQLQYRKLD